MLLAIIAKKAVYIGNVKRINELDELMLTSPFSSGNTLEYCVAQMTSESLVNARFPWRPGKL